MKLVVAPEAAAQILVRKQWWRANRSKAPERFDKELAAALAAIRERPESFQSSWRAGADGPAMPLGQDTVPPLLRGSPSDRRGLGHRCSRCCSATPAQAGAAVGAGQAKTWRVRPPTRPMGAGAAGARAIIVRRARMDGAA